jgi:hypothetical protein
MVALELLPLFGQTKYKITKRAVYKPVTPKWKFWKETKQEFSHWKIDKTFEGSKTT